MMNEFPRDFPLAWQQIRDACGGDAVVGFNGTEYLELCEAAGISEEAYPVIQAYHQHKIWQRVNPNDASPEAVEKAIAEIKSSDAAFHMDGASWSNNISWVKGYENVLKPINALSAMFHRKFDPLVTADPSVTVRADYKEALVYTLLTQTSCFRYWGQGKWTEYAQELYRRGEKACT